MPLSGLLKEFNTAAVVLRIAPPPPPPTRAGEEFVDCAF
jgi:hypothetical protein